MFSCPSLKGRQPRKERDVQKPGVPSGGPRQAFSVLPRSFLPFRLSTGLVIPNPGAQRELYRLTGLGGVEGTLRSQVSSAE